MNTSDFTAEHGRQQIADARLSEKTRYESIIRDLEAMGDAPGGMARVARDAANLLKRHVPKSS